MPHSECLPVRVAEAELRTWAFHGVRQVALTTNKGGQDIQKLSSPCNPESQLSGRAPGPARE